VKFLSNGDTDNLMAHEFVKGGFKARVGDIQGLMGKLEQQVFHLAENRPKEALGKFNTDNVKPVFEWVEKNFALFLSKLSPEQRAMFNYQKADPAADQITNTTPGYTGSGGPPAACTSGPLDSQNQTSSGPQGFYGVDGPGFRTVTNDKPNG